MWEIISKFVSFLLSITEDAYIINPQYPDSCLVDTRLCIYIVCVYLYLLLLTYLSRIDGVRRLNKVYVKNASVRVGVRINQSSKNVQFVSELCSLAVQFKFPTRSIVVVVVFGSVPTSAGGGRTGVRFAEAKVQNC